MKKLGVIFFLLFSCFALCFSSGKRDMIINASIDNIEQLSNKKRFAFFYSEDNDNALQIAMQGENVAVAEWLIENDVCDLNHQNIFGRTALNDAIELADIDILKLLVQHGAKIKREKYLQDPVIQTVTVGNVEAAEFFSQLDIKYNFIMPDGKNMIHYAVLSCQKEIIPFLVKNGCNIDGLDADKTTPLLLSIANDDSELAEALLYNGAKIELKNETGQSPIFHAIQKFSNSTLKTLIEHKANIEIADSQKRTPFLFAYEIDNIDAATILLKEGASFPRQQLLLALKNQRYSYLPLLLESGADISTTDDAGQNALHIAASKSDGNSLSLLLEVKDSHRIINSKDKKGNTPLILACGAGTGFTNGVKTLLQAGASVLDTDANGNQAIHVSAMSNRDSSSKELCQIIFEKDNSVLNRKNNSGQTALMLALKNAKTETSTYLLEHKAEVAQKDSTGNTALHYAARNNMNEAVPKIVALGAVVNGVNNSNETPLCIAAKNKNEKLSDYFLSFKGINIDIKDSYGKTARNYLWDLYDLRIEESASRRRKYIDARQKAWDAVASARDSKYEIESKIRKLENENRNLQGKINSAKQGTNTSSWSNQITANNFSITAYNISIAAFNVAINKAEASAGDFSKKIDEEFKISQSYIDKKTTLNEIPRQ